MISYDLFAFSEVKDAVWKDGKIIGIKQSLIESLLLIYNLELTNSLEMHATTYELLDRNIGVVPCVKWLKKPTIE